jgi:hypothetical protein
MLVSPASELPTGEKCAFAVKWDGMPRWSAPTSTSAVGRGPNAAFAAT